MSSREIAELTGNMHKNVMRDISAMLTALKSEPSDFEGSYIDPTGRTLPCFNLPKREIAELTGKEHKHVKREIEVMLDQLCEDGLKFERIYFDSMNRQQAEYLLPNSALTMSSREIAELTGKRHDHVMRDITVMLTELHGAGGLPKFGDTYRNEQNGQLYPCFKLPKREIAELTGKHHHHVLRDIDALIEQAPAIASNFGSIEIDTKVGFGTRKDGSRWLPTSASATTTFFGILKR